MSVSIQTVEFERRDAYLSELDQDPPYTVHGVALGAGDVTVGQSGIKKLWPAEELKEAADTLEGTNLVEDHENDSRGVVGEVTKAGYKDSVGVIYEAELFDEELAEKIDNGLLEVSIRGMHIDVEQMEETEEGAKIVEDITFDNLSIVPTGAAPSNTIEMGETEELSMAELSAFTESLESTELQEIEPGMWVKSGDTRGVTISQVEDGEVEVDVYEEVDGKWRSTGETEMMSVDSLEEWDVDEEEDIGPMEDEEDDEDEEEDSEEASERVEGEEESGDLDEIKEQSPERFPEEAEHEQLQEMEIHSVDFSGTTESDWSKPAMEDFDTEDLSEIDDHFLVSRTGFPPENFTDLALPVVEPNGNLNLNALQNAKARAGQVEGLDGDDLDRVTSKINTLANENFDTDFEDEEEAQRRPRTIDDTGDEQNVQDVGPVDISLDLINKYLQLEGKHERDSVNDMLAWIFGSTDLPMETVSDLRTASTSFLNQTPGTDSFDGMTIEQFRDWLLMHGEGSQGRREQKQRGGLPPGEPTPVNVLTGDDLRQRRKSEESELDDITTKVNNMTEDIEEKLAELNEPVAVEQDDLEELQQKADRFEEMSETLESLKERTDILDEADREQVEELAEADEPVVIESARKEQLEQEAEQVKTVYAAALSEELGAFSAEELTDKFTIEELREKFEEQIGDPEEELASSEEADPRSGDVEEEELEERAEEEENEEEELSDEEEQAEEMRAQLKEKIFERN